MNQKNIFFPDNGENIIELWSEKITEPIALNLEEKQSISSLMLIIDKAILAQEKDETENMDAVVLAYCDSRFDRGAKLAEVAREYSLLRQEIINYLSGDRLDLDRITVGKNISIVNLLIERAIEVSYKIYSEKIFSS